MSHRRTFAGVVGLALATLVLVPRAHASITFPYPFWYFSASPGATFDTPTGIAFLPDGRLLVAEKRGRVYVVDHGTKLPTPMWQRENEVLNNGDRGLLDVAVDPDFATNRYIYLLYTVDPDSNGVDDNDDAFARLTRYQVSAADPNVVDYTTRTILFGRTWSEGPTIGSITHTIGSLRWGADKSLLITCGDGAQYTNTDSGGQDPGMFGPGQANPLEDIGAFRAQYVNSLDGKVLRIDPHTGLGYPSNPFYDGNPASVRSRVYCYGLRNPFRFNVRPGTGSTDPTQGRPGTLLIGDVGWSTWEEVDVAKQGGMNFGWPCYEGFHANTPYLTATPSHNGCGSTGTTDNPSSFTAPVADWSHFDASQSNPPIAQGNSSIGGVFYTGVQFPAQYRGLYFFGDYGFNWIRTATLDGSDNVTAWANFAQEVQGPVDFAVGPYDGDLYYVSIVAGEVRRIHYYPQVGGNVDPVAAGSATPQVGSAPLTVNFSSTGSSDANGDSLFTTWDFGDGSGSFLAAPTHTYTIPGTYTVHLSCDDNHLGYNTTTFTVVVSQSQLFPATGSLDEFNRPDGAIGGAWVDPVYGLGNVSLAGGQLVQNCCNPAAPVWNGAIFGPDQEAYLAFTATGSNAPEQSLMLKLQGPSADSSHIRVRYDATYPSVQVYTYTPGGGMVARGAAIPASFAVGDTLGARAYSNGSVQVFQNGALIGTTTVGSWSYAGSGGRLGLAFAGAYASKFDHFGGGNFIVSANTKPIAVINAPAESTFYAVGDTIPLLGTGNDAQQVPDSLSYSWNVILHHNTHIHPNTFTSSARNTYMIGQQHDDGTGVWYQIGLTVTDAGSLSDSARVDIFPDIDLQPVTLTASPNPVVSTNFASYSFRIRNNGRMPSPLSHWRLIAGNTMIAEGDTLIAAKDSATVTVWKAATLPTGTLPLRVKIDTLGTVYETNENNNAFTTSVNVVGSPTGVVDLPRRFALSEAYPNPSPGDARLALELPARSHVQFQVLDVQGREVWADTPRDYPAGRWNLGWDARLKDGHRAGSGLYLARLNVDGRTYTRRIAILR